jgi:PAS domain S-box-containing protein
MQKKKILIIDDFEPLLEEVSGFLAYEGYKIFTAKDGAEGIQVAIHVIPDLVICDIEMPALDGYAVFKALEQITATSNIPFIFLTARVQAQDFRKGLLLGADDYLIKPIELDELILTVRKRLEKNERLKRSNENIYSTIINNPHAGIYIYHSDKFVFVNHKFEEIVGYDRTELNNIELQEIILSDAENLIHKLCLCLKGIHERLRLKISILDKNKKVNFIDLYSKSVEIEGHRAIIGSVVAISQEKNSSHDSYKTDSPEIDEIINRLVEMSKLETANEIRNIQQLIAFDHESKVDKIKDKINISPREKEILELICKGFTNNEIAEKLYISNRTVDNHRAKLLEKTGTKNTAELVAYVITNKLIDLKKDKFY